MTRSRAESRPHVDPTPLGSKRFAVLSNHPVAAALNFQRILYIVSENVVNATPMRSTQHVKALIDKLAGNIGSVIDKELQLSEPETNSLPTTNQQSSDLGIPMKDAILYWKDNTARFPYLSKLAFSLFAIPASSASAEREFSTARWHSLGCKNRTTQDALASKLR
ncbi:hypothetical protein OUZ56_016362 [Daphnia magna]|uniref:HAT C-terminal dimerisation domain-containing protein n=1 Tax=Daphnia magna TaxID=35525 RepID=A0ABR0AQF1_9CRUS|nr:hypothetical protein OUZ56_016362 [Daphnia magna]